MRAKIMPLIICDRTGKQFFWKKLRRAPIVADSQPMKALSTAPPNAAALIPQDLSDRPPLRQDRTDRRAHHSKVTATKEARMAVHLAHATKGVQG